MGKKCYFCEYETREREVLYDHIFHKHSMTPIIKATKCDYCLFKSEVTKINQFHHESCLAKKDAFSTIHSVQKIVKERKTILKVENDASDISPNRSSGNPK